MYKLIRLTRKIIVGLSMFRLIPHWIIFNINSQKSVLKYDVMRWLAIIRQDKKYGIQSGFLYLMTFLPEFRNLFYYRIRIFTSVLKCLCRPMNTLFIGAKKEIGPGLFIQHGLATIIAAESIGKDCWINQQVTIGYSNDTDCPIIGNNVAIMAGAKVIGKVYIGNNSIVGANAVVVKNVPENCTVVGVPAYIVRKNGNKTKENL